jgi:peptidoglycan/xylan/chitin deacetylase (PgdA/CDA1 family)
VKFNFNGIYLVIILIFSFFISGCTEHAFIQQYFYKSPGKTTERSLSGRILWHGNESIQEIALTFDDGPNSKATPQILDILKKNNVPATFFVLGKFIEKNKDIIKRTANEGHMIGNHTFTHASGNITDIAKIKREIEKTDALIYKYSGITGKYFRPPFGYENWRFLSEAELNDHAIILWSLDVGDWNQNKTSKDYISRIKRRTKNGTIILLHDGGSSREAVIDALPIIIRDLKNKGYKFVTIDEMIEHL